MIHPGENLVDGVTVEVTRKRIRRINLRVAPDGRVHLSVPERWATLREAEAFLRANWDWVRAARARVKASAAVPLPPVDAAARGALESLLGELHPAWCARLGETGVAWKLRAMKSVWGTCHWRKRLVTYNTELARAPRPLVEYVIVHELSHLQAHDHGPRFYALMDERLPGWRDLRRRLSRRAFGPVDEPLPPPPPPPVKWVQAEFW